MWNSNHRYNLLQQWAGNFNWKSENEESDFSQENEVFQAGQGTESSQEETEHLEPWSPIFDDAEKRHETLWSIAINQYEENGDSENVARIKAENALLPVYRKELRKVLLGNLQWKRAMEKDPTFINKTHLKFGCLQFLLKRNNTKVQKIKKKSLRFSHQFQRWAGMKRAELTR